MRKIDWLVERYGESHRNPTNKAIHWVCVPVIVWCVLALFWSWSPYAAYVLIGASLLFYLGLSPPIAMGMLAILATMVYPLTLLGRDAWMPAVVLFVLAWIGQFIGHAIEGRRPSFLEDLRFLLVGPAWLLVFVYQRLGIRY